MSKKGVSLGLVKALVSKATGADPAVIEQAVSDWLDDHPEATTTVADGSITEQKLASAIAAKINSISSLSDEIVQLQNGLFDTNNKFPKTVLTGASIQCGTDEIANVILNGATSSIYDGMIVVDGNAVRITGFNGQSGDYNAFILYISNKANGAMNFAGDWLPTTTGQVERLYGRANSNAIEILLLNSRCAYTLDAVNAYFAEHPLTIWYQTTNSGTAFYQVITATYGANSVFRIGTAEPIANLAVGDYIDFGAKKIVRSGNASDIAIVNDISNIPTNAVVCGEASVTISFYQNLEDTLSKKVDIDVVNEINPQNTTFFDGVNYFDINKTIVINNRFVDSTGKITSASNITSVVFSVKPNTTYWFFAPGMNRAYIVENETSVFDVNATYNVLNNTSETHPVQFTTGGNAHYVFCYMANYVYDFTQNAPVLNENWYNGDNNPYVPSKYLPEYLKNNLDDTQLLIFGDSITDTCTFTINAQNQTTAVVWKNPSNSYTDAGGNVVTYSMWPKILKESQKFTEVRNYALSGASYKSSTRETGNERQNLQYQIDVALNDRTNPNNVFAVSDFVPDIVIFALGTNDGAPNDTPDDAMAKTVYKTDGVSIDVDATLSALDDTNFCESARKAFLRIKQAFPLAQIFCVLPIQRANNDINFGNLHAYLKTMAERYGAIVIDGTAESGITRDFNNWNGLGTYLKDGLHPNEKGQNLMARLILSKLKANYIPFGIGFN